MAYVPINTQAFVSAYAGALSGMAVSGWVVDPVSADYQTITEIVGAFAQAFDLAWNDATELNNLELRAIVSVAQQEFSGRGPGSMDRAAFSLAATWAVPAAALVALVLQADAYFVSQGINPGTSTASANAVLATLQASQYESNKFLCNATPNQLLAVSGSDFTLSGSSDFSLGADGVITYTGISRAVLASLTLTVNGGGVFEENFAAGVALNNDLVGDALFGDATTSLGVARALYSSLGRSCNLTSVRRIELTSGDTLRIVGGINATEDMLCENCTLSIFAAA